MGSLDLDSYFRSLGVQPSEPMLEGLSTLGEARATLARVEALLVAHARRRGSSWTEIGAALGISRQAAHARQRALSTRRTGTVPVRAVDGERP